jgi:hypothetical protein
MIAVIEIILAIVSDHLVIRIIGIVLHLFKMIVPFKLYESGLFELMGGLYSSSYAFTWFGYIFIAAGVGTLVLYILDLKKH